MLFSPFADSMIYLTVGPGQGRRRGRLRRTKKATARARDAAFSVQKGKCYWCERRMTAPSLIRPTPDSECTAEHLIERGRPGRDQSPIVAACFRCNNDRGIAYGESANGQEQRALGESPGKMSWV